MTSPNQPDKEPEYVPPRANGAAVFGGVIVATLMFVTVFLSFLVAPLLALAVAALVYWAVTSQKDKPKEELPTAPTAPQPAQPEDHSNFNFGGKE